VDFVAQVNRLNLQWLPRPSEARRAQNGYKLLNSVNQFLQAVSN
jgi:hypothetical protein